MKEFNDIYGRAPASKSVPDAPYVFAPNASDNFLGRFAQMNGRICCSYAEAVERLLFPPDLDLGAHQAATRYHSGERVLGIYSMAPAQRPDFSYKFEINYAASEILRYDDNVTAGAAYSITYVGPAAAKALRGTAANRTRRQGQHVATRENKAARAVAMACARRNRQKSGFSCARLEICQMSQLTCGIRCEPSTPEDYVTLCESCAGIVNADARAEQLPARGAAE
jgi:hypothetical protein